MTYLVFDSLVVSLGRSDHPSSSSIVYTERDVDSALKTLISVSGRRREKGEKTDDRAKAPGFSGMFVLDDGNCSE